MRVAIEAATLRLTSGGLSRYTSELSLALAHSFPEDEYYLVSDQPFQMPEGAPANLKRGGGPRSSVERRWWLWGLSRELGRLQADLIHGPDFAVPYLGKRPSVLTLHDLSPWMDERWHHDATRVRRRTPILLDLGLATMVITPSEMVRRQAVERFRLPPERVVTVPEAAPAWLRPLSASKEAEPYFLFVGTLEPRKNLEVLIEAWREVRRRRAVDLVLVGRRRADSPEIREEPGLRLAGEVADRELAALYSGALAFVYPSLYEGFGLPLLEAMQCGAPVIASRALRETGGDAAIYADGPEELARAMYDVATRDSLAASLRVQSLARARGFSWDRTARRTREVYEEARKRFEQ
ncbi:MAG TPA: glycosyltransferase family 1 protein [Candidatus Acidoferrales bacterium]|nr:glycosyltransferase family 1 protein [Candidatus Acidoferrales bacterium]